MSDEIDNVHALQVRVETRFSLTCAVCTFKLDSVDIDDIFNDAEDFAVQAAEEGWQVLAVRNPAGLAKGTYKLPVCAVCAENL